MMGLSKMTISRMLQKAKDLNIVNIDIVLPFKLNKNLGLKIKEKYKIDQAIVVKIEDDKQKEPLSPRLQQLIIKK
jgi:DNA-binding transcriptional regulator LsrR (DeoR family)